MICPQCQATVPQESAFCLRCGARLAPAERAAPGNGGRLAGARPVAAPARAAAPVASPPRPAPAPGSKQAYALSFKPLADERVRYRVARWVCEVAPAHGLTEVQEGLMRGDFATFLALTAEEAEAARKRIQALGVHQALVQFAPAADAALLLPERPPRDAQPASGWTSRQKFLAVAIFLGILLVVGTVWSLMWR